MAVTINKLEIPTNVQAVLQEGGTLLENTTYYVRVTAHSPNTFSYGAGGLCSEASIEISFLTTTTHKSALISWDLVLDPLSRSVAYNVYSSTVSGNYRNVSYNTGKMHGASTWGITTQTNSYLISSPSAYGALDTFARNYTTTSDSAVDHLSLDAGLIAIDLSGTETLANIKAALDTEGMTGYYYYDSVQNFTLKGSIIITGTSSGSLTVSSHRLTFYQGYMRNDNVNFNLSLTGCIINWEAYASGFSLTRINMTGCTLQPTVGNGFPPMIMGGFSNVVGIHSNIIDCNFMYLSNYSENPSNQKWYYPGGRFRNWGTQNVYNTDMTVGYFTAWAERGIYSFYDSKIKLTSANPIQMTGDYTAPYTIVGYLKFYDCSFVDKEFSELGFYWNNQTQKSFSDEIHNYFSIDVVVKDKNKNNISNVNIQIADKTGNILYDGITEKQYILTQKATNTPGMNGGLEVTQIEDYNPFTLVVSANGYETYTSTFDLTEKYKSVITLAEVTPVQIEYYPEGYTGELTGPLSPASPEGSLTGEDGMDSAQLITAIDEVYHSTQVTVKTFSTGGENNQEIIVTETAMPLSQAITEGHVTDDMRKAMSDSIAEKVIEHIKNEAATEGSTNEIINLKDHVSTINDNLMNFYTTLNSWVPVPMDGGAALKIALTSSLPTLNQALIQNDLEMETNFVYETMNKNII